MARADPLSAIVTTSGNAPLVASLHRFRRRLFVDDLGWTLSLDADGGERDAFDTERTVHVALLDAGEVVGGFRAIRADEPYLAAGVFPELASDHPYPTGVDAWEISRFGVRPEAGHHAVRALYATMFRFAHRRGARTLVALVDLAHERFLGTLGITTRRYGPPRVVGHDRAGRALTCVAGEIPLGAQAGPRFAGLARLAHTMEITDEALVLGLERLSA